HRPRWGGTGAENGLLKLTPMKKVMIGLFGCCMLAVMAANAQDGRNPAVDTRSAPDTAAPSQHSVISRDTAGMPVPDTSYRYHGDSAAATDSSNTIKVVVQTNAGKTDAAQSDAPKADQQQPKDTATTDDRSEETRHELDPRWFISPLPKVQFQDFGMLEKN